MRKVRRTSLGHIDWKNTTSVPTKLIAKWVRRSCQRWSQHLEIPADWTKRSLGTFVARNRYYGTASGRAYLFERRTVVSFCTEAQRSQELETWRRFFNVVAHEIGHMAVAHKERYCAGVCDAYLYPPREGTAAWKKYPRSRRNGKGWGGDEEYICRIAKKFEDEIPDEEVQGWIRTAREL